MSDIESHEVDELRAEIARLKADVAFKDSLIWTSRESELYKATYAAEQRAKQAEQIAGAAKTQNEKLVQLVANYRTGLTEAVGKISHLEAEIQRLKDQHQEDLELMRDARERL